MSTGDEAYMELRDYLEIGAKKAGSLTALGKILNISQPNMSNAKAQKKGLPLDAAVKLADYIDEELKAVIAANELVTEKKEEKRAYWRPFIKHARSTSIAASLFPILVVLPEIMSVISQGFPG
jgi:hypothetical protein